jgi:hypothetical protein
MTGTVLPLAHIAGIPLEELLGPLTPALTIMLALVGAHCRRLVRRWRPRQTPESDDAPSAESAR